MSQQLFIKSDLQREWLQKLDTIKDSIVANAQQNDEEAGFPYENIRKLKEIGYPKVTLPTTYGGEGFTIYDAVLAHERLASFDGSTALILAWSLLFVGDTFEQREYSEEALATIASALQENALFNKAVSEFAMGSPARGGKPATVAVRDGKEWLINGRKNYTTGSHALDYFVTFAWIEERQTTGYFLVPKDALGLSIEETWDVIAMRSTGSHDLVLNNVRLPENALIEVPQYNTGFKLNSWLLLIPATYLGIAQAARDYAVQFATTHAPNSIQGTIAELPNIQALIGEMDLALMRARFALYGTAEVCMDSSRKLLAPNAINVAKHTVTNEGIAVVDKAMRIVGAKSLTRSNPLQRYYRDIRAGLHNPPMDDMTIKGLAVSAIAEFRNDSKHK